jgi:hypothetical protein
VTPSPLLSTLSHLRQCHETVLVHGADTPWSAELQENLHSLRLAEAHLEKAQSVAEQGRAVLHLAVIGPTQAGKSSVVNWLLGASLAQVSPLAGHTIHAQAFVLGNAPELDNQLTSYLRNFRRCEPAQLPRNQYDCYALSYWNAPPEGLPTPLVVWDTPDFDSVSADAYQQAVLRTMALADVILLVVSKDKYADLSVWRMLKLLEPLAQPTLLCLNKVAPAARLTLCESLREKWRSSRADPPPAIICLPYEEGGLLPTSLQEQRTELLQALRGILPARPIVDSLPLLRAHGKLWLTPVVREQAQLQHWENLVDAALDDALLAYRRDFLDCPRQYETFQHALAELLTLLEVPGIARTLVTARRILTWPLRQLGRLGRSQAGGSKSPGGSEAEILRGIARHVLIRLNEQALEALALEGESGHWWRDLAGRIKGLWSGSASTYETEILRYQAAFRPQVDATAHQLLDSLRQHPALLNSLRATRVTADAAALALALHTGGIGVQDFVLAPAMLALTSFMTESALGHYLHLAEMELKRKQLLAVESWFRDTLARELKELPQLLVPGHRFRLPAADLRELEAVVNA